MPETLEAQKFLTKAMQTDVVDVRSPSEYRHGHIPGAVNIPLFDDDQRAEIGTIYTRIGREEAILRGLDIILPKTGKIIQELKNLDAGKSLLTYCWRGGMRSLNMAFLFAKAGYRVGILEGGYRAYRRFVRKQLDADVAMVILGGFTGSGKTEVLNSMAATGQQVIDLEGLALHKGSAFGGIGLPDQPTNEQFENDLFLQWSKLDRSRVVWVEDESRMIGKVTLPESLIRKIESKPMVVLDVPKEIRIERLVREYAGTDDELLCEAVRKIERRLGSQRTNQAIQSIRNNDYALVADNVLTYYDKAYAFSMQRRDSQAMHLFAVERFSPERIAKNLVEFIRKELKNGNDIPGL